MGIARLPDVPVLAPVRASLHAIWAEPAGPLGLPLPAAGYGRAELGLMHRIQDARTPAANRAAVELGDRGEIAVWDHHLERILKDVPRRDAERARALLGELRSSNDAMFDSIKQLVRAPRPFQVDPTLELVVKRPGSYSHPSGHAARAYANATFQAWLNPSKAAKYMREAEDIALSRTYAGAHFPTDVIAGARLGHANALALLARLGPEDMRLGALLRSLAPLGRVA